MRQVTAVPPDVLANDAMAITEVGISLPHPTPEGLQHPRAHATCMHVRLRVQLKSPPAATRSKAVSFDGGSGSKNPVRIDRSLGSLPEWAKAAPDIDFRCVRWSEPN